MPSGIWISLTASDFCYDIRHSGQGPRICSNAQKVVQNEHSEIMNLRFWGLQNLYLGHNHSEKNHDISSMYSENDGTIGLLMNIKEICNKNY